MRDKFAWRAVTDVGGGSPRRMLENLERRRLLATGPFEFFANRVVIEAEDFDQNTAQGPVAWAPIAEGVGGGMQATPPGTRIDTSIEAASARLDYQVSFPSEGDYWIWVRGRAVDGQIDTTDSLHVGLDGVVQESSRHITHFGAQWTWSGGTWWGEQTMLHVPSASEHTVNLYVREGGLNIDRLVLARSGSSQRPPLGEGPRSSDRAGGSSEDPAAVNGSLADPMPLAGPAEVAFDGQAVQSARLAGAAPAGGFYLLGQSEGQAYATRHFDDGSLDTSFADSGRRLLEPGSHLAEAATAPVYRDYELKALQGGGFALLRIGIVGIENHEVTRYDDELVQDTSFGDSGKLVISGFFAPLFDGRYLTLSSDATTWTRYDADGQVTGAEGAGDLLDGATDSNGRAYTSVQGISAFPDGSILLTLRSSDFHGFRKLTSEFEFDSSYWGDGIADVTTFDVDSFVRRTVVSEDSRVFVHERDTDGEDYLALINPSGTVTATTTLFFFGNFQPIDEAEQIAVRFDDEGGVSLAYAISNLDSDPPNYFGGFGFDRFNEDGTPFADHPGRDWLGSDFGDDTLIATGAVLLAEGTFLIAAQAGGDALLWRISPDDPDPDATVLVDFDTGSPHPMGYAEKGFSFVGRPGAGGPENEQLHVLGLPKGTSNQVLHAHNWGRRIEVRNQDPRHFGLVSFDYAAGRYGDSGDFVLTGHFADGSTQELTFSFSEKHLSTASINWQNLTRVDVNFAGGLNDAYGALDNFRFQRT